MRAWLPFGLFGTVCSFKVEEKSILKACFGEIRVELAIFYEIVILVLQ